MSAVHDPIIVRPQDVTSAPRPRRPTARRERARLRREERGSLRVSLWIPATMIFALLAPFALVLSPVLLFASRYRLGPHTVFMLGAVLLALSGTEIEVDAPDCRIRIYLF